MRRHAASWMLILTTLFGAGASIAADVTHRDVLVAALDLRDAVHRRNGDVPSGSAVALREAVMSGEADFLSGLAARLPPAGPLRDRLIRARLELRKAPSETFGSQSPIAKAIEFPEPAPMPRCIDASAATAHAMLEAWAASSEILAAAKWVCLQTEAGENSAFACTALAVETEALQTELDLESFCLGDQRDATMAALGQTQSNIVDFVNLRADATASSRASQGSVDAMQDTLDSLLLRLAALRTTLTADDHSIALALDDLLADAAAVGLQLTALSSDIHDIRFRVQAMQVDVEDAQVRTADVQTRLVRLASDTASLRGDLETTRSSLASVHSSMQVAANEDRDRRLAMALGDPDIVVIRYRLPSAQGGELERSREVLVRAIAAFESLSMDTTASRAQLSIGDGFYNQDRPLDAYVAYANAWRALHGAPTVPSVQILRNSFE